jgi:hypothetical protein
MTRRGPRLQPLDALTAILRLDGNGASAAGLGMAMRENRLPWAGVFALAEAQFLVPALWPALSAKGLVSPVPEAMRRFMGERLAAAGTRNVFAALEDRFRANAVRNATIRAQALQAIRALNETGIEPVVLKGTRLLLAGDSDFAAARLLRDIDLVVPSASGTSVGAALTAIGYIGDTGATAASPHGQSFYRPGDPASLDLHAAPLTLHEAKTLPEWLTEAGLWHRALPAALDGALFRRLPDSESLIHAILHTEVADLNYAAGDWALRYLYETAVVTRQTAIDWSRLDDLGSPALRRPVLAHLLAAARLFGAVQPLGLPSSLRLELHFQRCRLNARHPRAIRRPSFLAYKLRQAMSEWYLRRKGYYGDGRTGLWRARARALKDVLRRHKKSLPGLLLGGDDDPLPPPRV